MAKTSYHVVSRSNGRWSVKKEGAARASESFSTKQAAISGGRKLVVSSGGGSLVVHAKDGRVSSRAEVNPVRPVSTNGNHPK